MRSPPTPPPTEAAKPKAKYFERRAILPGIDDRPNDLIDTNRAARELGVSRNHLRRWILSGKIAAWRTGKRYFVSFADVKKLWRRVEASE